MTGGQWKLLGAGNMLLVDLDDVYIDAFALEIPLL